MASKKFPTNAGQLIALAGNMYQGITNLGTSVGITMVTAAQMQTDLNAFVAADTAFNAARSSRQTASDEYQSKIETIYAWLQLARNVLSSKFGTRWNTEWAQAGFINGSTGIPRNSEARVSLTLALGNFFTANPTYEAPSLDVTAAHAALIRTAALLSQQALFTAEMALSTAGDTRTSKQGVLVAAMRAVVKNLQAKLGPDDPRWMGFGLNMPGTMTTPGKPVNLLAHIDETGAILTQCDPVPLATRYRWRMLLVGVQSEYQLAARSVDPMAMISSVLPGQKVRLIVQAVNRAQQGMASDPIELTMPLLPAVAKAPEPIVPDAVVVVERNDSNSHTNGSRLPAMA